MNERTANRAGRRGAGAEGFCARSRRRRLARAAAAIALLASGCAQAPQRAGIPTEWRPSPNFDERRPGFVVLHYTSGHDVEHALATLTSPVRKVSAHYVIGREGKVYQLVDERARAWHAGRSSWGGVLDLNSSSIGIELDNDGESPYPDAQVASLLRLLADLTARLGIPPTHVIGHSDVAPRRKTDPGMLFPWKTLARAGFGLWCDPPYPPAPASFDAIAGLRVVGYDVVDPAAAIAAFKLHYLPGDEDPALDERGRALVQCLGRASLAR